MRVRAEYGVSELFVRLKYWTKAARTAWGTGRTLSDGRPMRTGGRFDPLSSGPYPRSGV
jgi:hypothetical protein